MKKHFSLLVVVVALFCLLGLAEYSNAQRSSSMKQTWEYQLIGDAGGKTDLMAQMNKLGAEGWELVSVTIVPGGPAVVYTVAYLKRPK